MIRLLPDDRRLRRVAKICESTGQRVQKSVFECQVNLMQLEELERQVDELDLSDDATIAKSVAGESAACTPPSRGYRALYMYVCLERTTLWASIF